MPMSPGRSNDVVSSNIKELRTAGFPQKQAVAAAMRQKDQSPKGFAIGGAPAGVVPGLGGGGTGGFGGILGGTLGALAGGLEGRSGSPAFNESWATRGASPPTPVPTPSPVATPGATSSMPSPVSSSTGVTAPPTGGPVQPQLASVPTPPTSSQPYGHIAPLPMGAGIMRADGGQVPWYARAEAKGMTHTGPIHSIVSGRTDHIPLKVPGGSYVLPADYVSHLGQNNTNAGMAKASLMFGHTGPFGTPITKVAQGRGAPHAPPAPRPLSTPGLSKNMMTPFAASGGKTFEGGVHGEDPIDIMAAGGEFVVHPDVVREIGRGNIDHGHKILDKHVMKVREEHKKTLAKLPPPAK